MKYIDEYKERLNKKKEKQELLSELFERNILATKTNEFNKIVYISDAYKNISGYTHREILQEDHNILRFYSLDKKLEGLIDQEDRFTIELLNQKKNGERYWVKAKFIPQYNTDGKYMGYDTIEEDITEKKNMQKISITDGLTGLYNRRYFDEVFQNMLNNRKNKLLILAIIDIDFFKQYNDTYGHQSGDETLKKVANSLKEELYKDTDYAFRLGGEEFGMLYTARDEDEIIEIAKSTMHNIEELNIEHSSSKVAKHVTISMGLYNIPKDQSSIQDIYKKTDDLLYSAKQDGRNCFKTNFLI